MNCEALLAWYHSHGRTLPWRTAADPYSVWVSELMLQQTRVDTVLGYYARWMEQFPDVQVLARAEQEHVLRVWQGLGYYRRARYLHEGARQIVATHQGQFPQTLAEALTLPGIGESTAASILSICFGVALPVFDGNVQRVAARYTACRSPLNQRATLHGLRAEVARWVTQAPSPGDFNQAMMDLGATVCLPRNPLCLLCPVRQGCQALARGIQDTIPAKVPKPPVPHVHASVVVLTCQGKVFLQQRPVNGLLGGLWELPGGKIEPQETPAQALVREVREELGLEVLAGPQLATVKHAYSHFKVTLHVFCCWVPDVPSILAGGPGRVWVKPEEFSGYPLPKATLKILEVLGMGGAGT